MLKPEPHDLPQHSDLVTAIARCDITLPLVEVIELFLVQMIQII